MKDYIDIINNGQRVATTSHAFDVVVTKELMRGYTLDASFANNNAVRKYIIPGAVLKLDGQMYDLIDFTQNSGTQNITRTSSYHISYRSNYYQIPMGYSFVGTVVQILQDMLNVATPLYKSDGSTEARADHASGEFTVGTCADIGTKSFALNNDQPVTLRSALMSIKQIGIEIDYDNLTINLPLRCGTGNAKTIQFGKDLCDFTRTWNKDNGMTYDAAIVDLQRIPGHESDVFDVGDDATINDKLIGDTVTKRVISYKKCYDNPTQDAITLGVFVRDASDMAVATQVQVNKSVKAGEKYSNVEITHQNGFMATSADGTLRVVMNADDCFAVQVRQSDGTYKTIQTLTAEGLGATKIFTIGNSGYYGIIGKGPNESDGYGLFLVHKDASSAMPYFKIYPDSSGVNITNSICNIRLSDSVNISSALGDFSLSDGYFRIRAKESLDSYTMVQGDLDKLDMRMYQSQEGGQEIGMTIYKSRGDDGKKKIEVDVDGGVVGTFDENGFHDGSLITGTFTSANGKTITVVDGVIKGL